MGGGGRRGGAYRPGGRCNGLPQAVKGAVATERGRLGRRNYSAVAAVGSWGSNLKSSMASKFGRT